MSNVIKPLTKRVRAMKLHQQQAWAIFKEQRSKPLAQPEKQAFLAALREYVRAEAQAEADLAMELR